MVIGKLRFYLTRNPWWTTPSVVVHWYGRSQLSLTLWDVGLCVGPVEVGIGWVNR